MSDILSFLGAVASHWVALMSGIVSLLITLVLRIKKVEPRDKIFWSIAALSFLLAFFLTWRDEHVSLINTKQELLKERDKNVPKLHGHIEQVIIRESPDVKGSQVFIQLSIGNIGGKSKVDNFLLDVESSDSDLQFKIEPAEFPKETISFPDEKSKVTITHQDSMEERAAKPVESGDRVLGWMRFVVENIKPEIIQRPKTKLKLSFKDVWEQTYSVTHEMP
jgi:hypothetical protein